MSETVDARGLSCPQPVLLLMDAFKKTDRGEILILVDTEASKENVSRAAKTKGWQVKEINEDHLEYSIKLVRN